MDKVINSFQTAPTLTTGRIILRPVEMSDAEDIFLLRANVQVNQFLGRPICTSLEEARQFIAKVMDGMERHGSFYWTILLTESNSLAGTICAFHFTAGNNTAEIGFELLPAYQGRGYMREALEKVIEFLFSKVVVKTLLAYTHRENTGSIKLLQKNGFQVDSQHQFTEEITDEPLVGYYLQRPGM